MQLPEIAIRRPVFATVLSLLILLIGAVSASTAWRCASTRRSTSRWSRSSVNYPGASAEVIESQVTKVLEDSHRRHRRAWTSSPPSAAPSRARSRCASGSRRTPTPPPPTCATATSRVRGRLPQAIDEPVIAKVEADAFPVIWLAFTSDTLTPLQINDLVNRIVKPRLQTVTGVADVRIFGERKYAMRVWLDPDKLAAYRLTAQDVEDAIRRRTWRCRPAASSRTQREFSVTSQTDLVRPAQFGEIVIKNVNGFPVRIRDVGARAGGRRPTSAARCA